MLFTVNRDANIDRELVQKFLIKHKMSNRFTEQTKLYNAYLGKYDILDRRMDKGKPNNKITNNFAKFITDTFCGFFDGNPVIVSSTTPEVQEAVDNFNNENTTVDLDYEIIKTAAIFGHAYELIYQNEEGITKTALVTPLNGFVVYDNSIEHKPMFAVRYIIDSETSEMYGEVYTNESMFEIKGSSVNVDTMNLVQKNEFYQVNMIEYVFNKERQGIFENAMSLIDAYNKVMSDKANDVDYFSDAILKIVGAELPDFEINGRPATHQEKIKMFTDDFRNARVIFANGVHMGSDKPERPDIEFLGKPESDTTQENLLDRLEDQIFQMSMVANISDKDFGNATSGQSLRYKLLAMRNLARVVEHNVTKAFKKRYELVFSFESNISRKYADEYKKLMFNFSENLPDEESLTSDTVIKLLGSNLISRKTAMELLPFIDDAEYEQELINNEEEQVLKKRNNDLDSRFTGFDKEVMDDEEERTQKNPSEEEDRQESRRKNSKNSK